MVDDCKKVFFPILSSFISIQNVFRGLLLRGLWLFSAPEARKSDLKLGTTEMQASHVLKCIQ